MKFPLLTISVDGGVGRRSRQRKTRAFSCTLLHCVAWPAYRNDKRNLRPIFFDFCGTESEHRAFTANLRCGNPAALSNTEAIELLKSESYIYVPSQRCDAGVRQIVYLPELFDLEVKSQRDDIWLCVMPPERLIESVTAEELACSRTVLAQINSKIASEQRRVEAENAIRTADNEAYYATPWHERSFKRLTYQEPLKVPQTIELDDEALMYWALMARELGVRLDARTRYPMPPSPEFRTRLLQTLITERAIVLGTNNPLMPLSHQREQYRMPLDVRGVACGYLPPMGLRIKQDDLGALLIGVVKEA